MDETELQHWIVQQLRKRRDLATDPEVLAIAQQHFRAGLRLSPVEQLEVYRQQFWLRHTAALLEDFPTLALLLGQTDWERLSEIYLEHADLSSFSLRDLGAGFPACVAEQRWLPRPELCADVARFEWALVEAFDAADASPVTPAELGSISEEHWTSARLTLQPALRLLDLRYPVPALAARLEAGEPLPQPVAPEACRLAVHRNGVVVAYEPLGAAAFAVLSALERGDPLVAACEAAVREGHLTHDELAREVGVWFESWARLGLIAAVSSA